MEVVSRRRGLGVALTALVLGLVLVEAPAATAVASCETGFPPDYTTAGTSMEHVYWAAAAVGSPADIALPELCVGADATASIVANPEGMALDILGDGSLDAGVTMTPPAVDYSGVARVDLLVVDGTVSFTLELYGLFGVTPTIFDPDRPDPVAEPAGAPGFFELPPLTLRDGATLRVEVVRETAPVSIELVESPSRGIIVTPSGASPQTIGVDVLVTDDISSTRYQLFLWSGVPIPTGAVWAPNPGPVAIEPGGTGFFSLSGSFVPPDSECEIKVMAEPDVELAVEPPSLQGVSFAPVGIEVRDPDFIGVLVVSYDLSCVLPDDSTSGVEYDLVLYVGVPLPVAELADTGSALDVPGALAALLAVIGVGAALAFVSGRRAHRRS